MKFTKQQAAATEKFERWFAQAGKKPYFTIAGWAGTGKSTIVRHITSAINGKVYYAASTGKAAYRLSQLGVNNVSTIHKLIYVPTNKSLQRLKDLEAERAEMMTLSPIPQELIAKLEGLILAEKKNIDRPLFKLNLDSPAIGAALIVVDEFSMINEVMGEDLLSFGAPILALGDPGQLPPVQGRGYFSADYDVMLTDIQRNAGPIAWLAREVREGRHLKVGDYDGCQVVDLRTIGKQGLAERIIESDQLLVGKNATRKTSNSRVRELLGRLTQMPVTGDKLVCLRNNYEIGVLNGQIWEVANDPIIEEFEIILSLKNEEGEKVVLPAHRQYFEGGEPEFYEITNAQCFDYGYALTVHKAQGSEFGSVVLLDEWFSKHRKEWLYTAITRASDKITIVNM